MDGVVAVTGGTGFVGRAVCAELAARGWSVRALSRSAGSVPGAGGVAFVEGDILRPDTLAGAFAGANAVVHLVGIIAEPPGLTFHDVHVEGTRHVLAAARAAGVRRFVHVSALGTRPHGGSAYHRTKWEAEESVRGSGLEWTILRPGLIAGADGFVGQFARMMRFPWNALQAFVVPCFGDGLERFQPVALGDVARAVAAALERTGTVGKTLDLCGDRAWTLEEMLVEIARALGKRPTVVRRQLDLLPFALAWAWLASPKPLIVRLPFPLARAIGFLMEKALARPPLTSAQVAMLEEGSTGDGREAGRLLGIEWADFGATIRAALGRGVKAWD